MTRPPGVHPWQITPPCIHLGHLDRRDGLTCRTCTDLNTDRAPDAPLAGTPSWQPRRLRTPALSRTPWQQPGTSHDGLLIFAVLTLVAAFLMWAFVHGQQMRCDRLAGTPAAASYCPTDTEGAPQP